MKNLRLVFAALALSFGLAACTSPTAANDECPPDSEEECYVLGSGS